MIKPLFLLLIMSATLYAGNDEELFLRGNKYYQQKDYENALASYQLVNAKGRAVLYNMGNCYFHKNDFAQALIYWKRAEKGATRQERDAIDRNKQEVLKKLGKVVPKRLMNFSLFVLQLLFLLVWFLLMFVVYKRDWLQKRVVIGCSCIVFLMTLVLEYGYMSYSASYGIIVHKQASLLAGPDKGFQTLSPLAYADQVIIKEKREGWYKIDYNDRIGWVEVGAIEIV